jgi:YVTN family beta-propeller protein
MSAALILTLWLAAPARVVDAGLAVDFARAPETVRDGEPLALTFGLSDVATGTPLRGVGPAAWLSARRESGELTSQQCSRKAAAFLGGSLSQRPAVDLNGYLVVTLDDEPQVSVVDPRFGFGGSRLLAKIPLPAPGSDWVLTPDGRTLFVSVPEADALVVADTASWKVKATVSVGVQPARVVLEPGGRRLWALTNAGVTLVDVATLDVVARLAVGDGGPKDLAFDDDGRYAFLTTGRALRVVALDEIELTAHGGDKPPRYVLYGEDKPPRDVEYGGDKASRDVLYGGDKPQRDIQAARDVVLGFAPRWVAFSSAARMAYAADPATGRIAAVDARSGRVLAEARVEPGFTQVRFAPGGRYAFLPNPARNLVQIFDAARNRVERTADVALGPDRVSFSDRLAYIRRRESATVLMLPLATLDDPSPAVGLADFPAGEHALGVGTRASTLADSIVEAPDGPAALVANPADRAVYFYKEGMAAPMGSFATGGSQPRAVLVVDRRLREQADGRYTTTVQVQEPGAYDVVLFVDAPRLVACFSLDVAARPETLAARLPRTRVERVSATRDPAAQHPLSLRVRLSDADSGAPREGLADVQALLLEAPGIWQQQAQARAVGNGVYAFDLTAPRAGTYYVWVSSPAASLPLHNAQFLTFQVRPARHAQAGRETAVHPPTRRASTSGEREP